MRKELAALECMLFVAGEPVLITELQRALNITKLELSALLQELKTEYNANERGFLLSITDETVQLCSNPAYAPYVEELLQPVQEKTISQSLLETLAVVAYRQPATRADIESIRGVRCEYAVSQLLKLNLIQPIGRKVTVGRPVLYGTTDKFLRQFGIEAIIQLPNFDAYSTPAIEQEDELIV